MYVRGLPPRHVPSTTHDHTTAACGGKPTLPESPGRAAWVLTPAELLGNPASYDVTDTSDQLLEIDDHMGADAIPLMCASLTPVRNDGEDVGAAES